MNKKTLKKHHFWVLSGLVPLLVFITFLLVTNGVGGAIDKQAEDIDKANKALASKTSLKAQSLITQLDGQMDELKKKKGELWKKNWDQERQLFTWPTRSPKLQAVAAKEIPFGGPIPNANSEREEFKNPAIYLEPFEKMAAGVVPTRFYGDAPNDPGWKKVLRHVNDWGIKTPDSNQVWMAMEDIWVQRALVGAVRTVNDQMATFSTPAQDKSVSTPVPHFKTRSRLWEADLWIERRGADSILKGSLKNLTDRLQLLGVGNTMRLLVWLDDRDLANDADAFEFLIEGEFVRAHAYAQAPDKAGPEAPPTVIKEIPKHTIPPGKIVKGIYKVRQKFDNRTVPVRWIDKVQLNYKDARHADRVLVPLKPDPAPAALPGGIDGMGGVPGGVMPPMPTFTPPAEAGMPGGTGVGVSAGGTVDMVIAGNKNRYLESTEQVRRMPVAMVVVLDQMYVQDFLIALANLPLRFQTTATHWNRFRDNRSTGPLGGPTGAGDGSDAPVLTTDETVQGIGFGPSEDPYRGVMRPGLPRPPVSAPGMPFGPASGSLTTVSEGQFTAGLVQLTAYGIVSLYAKYQDQPLPADPNAPVPGTEP